MADNLTTPLTNGTVIAADDVGGVIYPRTKISLGADGAASDISDSNPLPVKSDNIILDHANATKTTVTSSTVVLIPPAGCRYISIYTTELTFIRTDGTAAADASGGYPVDGADLIPVTPGVNVTAFAPVSSTVYVVPYKDRP